MTADNDFRILCRRFHNIKYLLVDFHYSLYHLKFNTSLRFKLAVDFS